MTIAVGELVSNLRQRSRAIVTPLREVELIADGDFAGVLRVGEEHLPWSERTAQMVMAHLKGPAYKYLTREPLDWQRTVVQHHVKKMEDNQSRWYIEGSNVAGVYHMDTKVIPLVDVAEQVADVFNWDDRASVLYGPDQVEINVISNIRTVTIPGIPGVESRPMAGTLDHHTGIKVGDLSAGGCRIIITPGKPERAPIVEELWERYVCINGQTRRVPGSQINLRGRTVDEILAEMNNVMRTIWNGLEASAHAILHSSQTPLPSSPSDFIREVATERRVNDKTIVKLQRRAAELPPSPSVYDVTQLFTSLANEEGLPVKTRRDLQAIGGDLTLDTTRMVHRCSQCAQPVKDKVAA